MSLLYNGKLVTIALDGELVEGAADGDIASIEHNSARVSKTAGVTGTVAINVLHDRTGTVTVPVWYGSSGSKLLNGWHRKLLNGQPFIFELVITEIASGAKFVAEKAWVEEEPGTAFGAENQAEEWVIGFESMDSDRQLLPGA